MKLRFEVLNKETLEKVSVIKESIDSPEEIEEKILSAREDLESLGYSFSIFKFKSEKPDELRYSAKSAKEDKKNIVLRLKVSEFDDESDQEESKILIESIDY